MRLAGNRAKSKKISPILVRFFVPKIYHIEIFKVLCYNYYNENYVLKKGKVMPKQIVTNSRENQEAFVEELEKYREEMKTLNKRASLKEGVDENHTLYEVAKKLVDAQNSREDNIAIRNDISDSDYTKLASFAKYRKIQIEDALKLVTDNLRYIPRGREYDKVSRMFETKEDLISIFKEYYRKNDRNLFPKNVIQNDNYTFLRNFDKGLSMDKTIELIIRVFAPELLDESEEFHATDKATKLTRDKTGLHELAEIVRENYADENFMLDSIFAEKNEKDLVQLIRYLESQWVTFEEFVTKYVSFGNKEYNYTRCFTADSTKVGPKLVDYYLSTYHTTRAMQDIDPYLYTKLRSAMDALNIHEIGKLVKYWRRKSDNEESHNMFNKADLKIQEDDFIRIINSRFDGVVPEKLKVIDRKTYEQMCFLSRRRGFKNNDEYIKSIGLSRRKPLSTGTSKGVNFFTDVDLSFYRIFSEAQTDEDYEELMRYMGIKLINVDEKHLKIYRKLAWNKEDSRAYANIKTTVTFGDN